MTVTEVLFAFENGAYCRTGDTGRGQVWKGGSLLGVCGPAVLRQLRDEPYIESGTLEIYGVPRRVYRRRGCDPFNQEGNFTSAR